MKTFKCLFFLVNADRTTKKPNVKLLQERDDLLLMTRAIGHMEKLLYLPVSVI